MEIKDIEKEIDQIKKTPTLWKWYFGLHPRIILSVPIFLLFVYQGLWFIWAEIQDVVFFFQYKEVTWGAIFWVFIFGSILVWFLLLPIYICFYSIDMVIPNKHWEYTHVEKVFIFNWNYFIGCFWDINYKIIYCLGTFWWDINY